MSRAYGKRTPRGLADLISTPPQDGNEGGEQPGEQALNLNAPTPHSPAGVLESEGAGQASEGRGWYRGIPGGQNHTANPPTVRQQGYSKPAEWPYRGTLLAHGVDPDEHGMSQRDPRLAGGQTGRPEEHKPLPVPSPVPVYIVEGGDAHVTKWTSSRHITCPASTNAEPARVCTRNPDRVSLRVLNEDTATDIRIGLLAELVQSAAGGVIGGALIPWPCNSYTALDTQDELFAQGATGSGTPRLSIIETFEHRAGI